MSGDFATAGALGGIRGSLRRVANHWQVTAFKLQNERSEWKALSRRTLEALEKEEQVSADLRQQLEQAQEALRVENSRANRCAAKVNVLLEYAGNVRAHPNDVATLTRELKASLAAIDSQSK